MSKKINSLSVNRDSHNRGIGQNQDFYAERPESSLFYSAGAWFDDGRKLVGCQSSTSDGCLHQNHCEDCLFAALEIPCLLDLNEEYSPIFECAGIELPF